MTDQVDKATAFDECQKAYERGRNDGIEAAAKEVEWHLDDSVTADAIRALKR